jgi:hypothetical protein
MTGRHRARRPRTWGRELATVAVGLSGMVLAMAAAGLVVAGVVLAAALYVIT